MADAVGSPWRNRSVFITGGTGSFGQAAIRRALDGGAAKVIIYSRDEMKQAALADRYLGEARLRYFLGDVRDPWRLSLALRDVDIVLHAAALKRVEEGEYNPTEFVATNIDGTRNVLRAALDAGVAQVVVLSTDKACQPVNLYGTTKLCAEKLTQAMQAMGGNRTAFHVVRYGNVAGSRGSVIPRWREAVARGDGLTLTDATMTRFWITLTEAVDLVEYALTEAPPATVCVPRLPAYTLGNLAHALLPTAPETPLPPVRIVGRRAGEKLHEAMIGADECAWTQAGRSDTPYCLTTTSRTLEAPWTRCPEGFTLTSDRAAMLMVSELRQRLADV